MARMKLVIVESPTKAKTIQKYLGRGYTVTSSFGHIRDLPKSKIGVDVEHDFTPQYVIPTRAKKVVSELKKLAKKASTVILATDEDREGEAIAWHLTQALDLDGKTVERIAFHEITEGAIQHALEHPRQLDTRLVEAQQTRRILDRLVGYELSPFLWRKIYRGLSAGRVQSVAVRLIVEREREIQAFNPQEYWTLDGTFQTTKSESIQAKLQARDGVTLEKFAVPSGAEATALSTSLEAASYAVSDVKQRRNKKTPPQPFTTSLLQQEASRRLGMSPKLTMMIAQQLYEGVALGKEGHVGLITYMRTDSANLSEKFLEETKHFLASEYGEPYAASAPRVYKSKSKNAQEAHEAVRPTDVTRTPKSIAEHLDPRQKRLYDLIWKRAVASQMPDAESETTTIDIATQAPVAGHQYTFRASGSVAVFDGWRRVYPSDAEDQTLPSVTVADAMALTSLTPTQHFTEPPARYSEATLIKSLEEYGIGRPSTYAPTVSTVVDRGYVERVEKTLKPTDLAFMVNDLLVEHFPKVVDFQFTAHLEEDLDAIAEGTKEPTPFLSEFYGPFEKNLREKEEVLKKADISQEKTDEICDQCGKPMVIKMGRYGKFIACSGWPDCKFSKPMPGTPEAEGTDEVCVNCGKPMVVKRGRFGVFLGCSGYPDCKTIKKIEKKVGVKCPTCTVGDIVEKKSRKGMFYGCNRYPACDFTLWSKPTGATCPKCQSLVVYAAKGMLKCSSKECDFTKEGEDEHA